MSSPSTTYRIHEPSALKTIFISTLIAGTLDISAAIIQFYLKGGQPIKIFYYIASGVFGKEIAYGNGDSMAVLGLLFHYVIVFIWSIFMFLIYPWARSIFKNKILLGVLYGIFVWLVMNRVVVPLSNTPSLKFTWDGAIIGCLILIFCIGIPITWIVSRFYSRREI